MKRSADSVFTYQYAPEKGQNPYIGFMSFQHFRGEKLYADIVVTPEAKMTETERVECYPVSADAEECGPDEGYYPDTTIVYIRVLWKEFEPERGAFNYELIDSILNDAKTHGQTLIFRLLPHSTRACDDVPEWLKSLVDCPERPPMKRVKDSPTDPLFIELFLNAIRKLGERYDADPTLDAMDISLPGAWGEGYKLELYPDSIFEQIMDTYLDVFRETQLITQVSRPNLVEYARKRGVNVGWRGDGVGEPDHLENIYPEKVKAIADNWKSAPVSFEAYWWLGEWQRQGWDIDRIIQRTLDWHVSSFNAKSLPCPVEWKEKIEAWIRKMGYHFMIDRFECPSQAGPDDTLECRLTIVNVGVAPIYKKLPLRFRLTDGNREYLYDSGIDISAWMPGKSSETLEIALNHAAPGTYDHVVPGTDDHAVPGTCDGVVPGSYDLEIGIISPHAPVMYFATDAEQDGAFYKVGKIEITQDGNKKSEW